MPTSATKRINESIGDEQERKERHIATRRARLASYRSSSSPSTNTKSDKEDDSSTSTSGSSKVSLLYDKLSKIDDKNIRLNKLLEYVDDIRRYKHEEPPQRPVSNRKLSPEKIHKEEYNFKPINTIKRNILFQETIETKDLFFKDLHQNSYRTLDDFNNAIDTLIFENNEIFFTPCDTFQEKMDDDDSYYECGSVEEISDMQSSNDINTPDESVHKLENDKVMPIIEEDEYATSSQIMPIIEENDEYESTKSNEIDTQSLESDDHMVDEPDNHNNPSVANEFDNNATANNQDEKSELQIEQVTKSQDSKMKSLASSFFESELKKMELEQQEHNRLLFERIKRLGLGLSDETIKGNADLNDAEVKSCDSQIKECEDVVTQKTNEKNVIQDTEEQDTKNDTIKDTVEEVISDKNDPQDRNEKVLNAGDYEDTVNAVANDEKAVLDLNEDMEVFKDNRPNDHPNFANGEPNEEKEDNDISNTTIIKQSQSQHESIQNVAELVSIEDAIPIDQDIAEQEDKNDKDIINTVDETLILDENDPQDNVSNDKNDNVESNNTVEQMEQIFNETQEIIVKIPQDENNDQNILENVKERSQIQDQLIDLKQDLNDTSDGNYVESNNTVEQMEQIFNETQEMIEKIPQDENNNQNILENVKERSQIQDPPIDLKQDLNDTNDGNYVESNAVEQMEQIFNETQEMIEKIPQDENNNQTILEYLKERSQIQDPPIDLKLEDSNKTAKQGKNLNDDMKVTSEQDKSKDSTTVLEQSLSDTQENEQAPASNTNNQNDTFTQDAPELDPIEEKLDQIQGNESLNDMDDQDTKNDDSQKSIKQDVNEDTIKEIVDEKVILDTDPQDQKLVNESQDTQDDTESNSTVKEDKSEENHAVTINEIVILNEKGSSYIDTQNDALEEKAPEQMQDQYNLEDRTKLQELDISNIDTNDMDSSESTSSSSSTSVQSEEDEFQNTLMGISSNECNYDNQEEVELCFLSNLDRSFENSLKANEAPPDDEFEDDDMIMTFEHVEMDTSGRSIKSINRLPCLPPIIEDDNSDTTDSTHPQHIDSSQEQSNEVSIDAKDSSHGDHNSGIAETAKDQEEKYTSEEEIIEGKDTNDKIVEPATITTSTIEEQKDEIDEEIENNEEKQYQTLNKQLMDNPPVIISNTINNNTTNEIIDTNTNDTIPNLILDNSKSSDDYEETSSISSYESFEDFFEITTTPEQHTEMEDYYYNTLQTIMTASTIAASHLSNTYKSSNKYLGLYETMPYSTQISKQFQKRNFVAETVDDKRYFDVGVFLLYDYQDETTWHQEIKHLQQSIVNGGYFLLYLIQPNTTIGMEQYGFSFKVWGTDPVIVYEDDELFVLCLQKRPCLVNVSSCKKDTGLKYEFDILNKVTITSFAHEYRVPTNNVINKDLAMHALQKYGFCIIKNFLPSNKVQSYNQAATKDMNELRNAILHKYGIDIVTDDYSDHLPKNYTEMSIKDNHRVELFQGPNINQVFSEILYHQKSINEIISKVMNPVNRNDSFDEYNDFDEELLENFKQWDVPNTHYDNLFHDTKDKLKLHSTFAILLPNSKDEQLKSDTSQLFECYKKKKDLPPHSVYAFIPTSSSMKSNGSNPSGGTAFIAGSHLSYKRNAYLEDDKLLHHNIIRPSLMAGDVILFDSRIMYFGLGNTLSGDDERVWNTTLCLNWTKSWFVDPSNTVNANDSPSVLC